jgi:hypothetical protein
MRCPTLPQGCRQKFLDALLAASRIEMFMPDTEVMRISAFTDSGLMIVLWGAPGLAGGAVHDDGQAGRAAVCRLSWLQTEGRWVIHQLLGCR